MTHDGVTVRVLIAAPMSVVYQALTSSDALRTWFAEHVDSAPEQGRYAFWGRYTPYGTRPRQRAVAVEPGRSVRFTWSLPGLATEVDVRIGPAPEGDTTLVLRHGPMPAGHARRAVFELFWTLSVGNLANYVEGRHLVPRCDYSTARATSTTAEVLVDAPAEDIVSVLTTPGLRGRVLGTGAEPGAEAWSVPSGPATQPPLRLMWRWRQHGGPETLVRWWLVPDGLEFRVGVRHALGTRESFDYYRSFWRAVLLNLQRMLELGDRWRPVGADRCPAVLQPRNQE